MTTLRPELRFERLLAALERDLLGATDQEILEAANEIGMDPTLRGSAALFGATFTIELTERARARLRSQNLWFAAASPRTRPKRSSGSSTSPRPRRRSKRETPPSD